ncbi:MipA/OmpV family protein [Salipiger sp.]|uniref:MipA/OmpV family protein n=1 Tax=Salipiger sp. TaxID=2078585 RepID=UPI003A96FB5B
MMLRHLAVATVSTLALAAPLQAQDGQFSFTLRGGVSSAPEYFGSDDYKAGPDAGFRFNYLRLGNGREFGTPDPWDDPTGWGLHGSFRYIGERDSSDHSELRGLDDVDAALELGLGIGYSSEYFSGYADVRRGFGGHESWVGEIGADAILRPTPDLRLSLGPRLFYGSDGYTDTYFGITPAEASATLPAYDPDGGLVSAGIELGARYRINDAWGLEGAVTWQQFRNDAADSPIVENGSDDQWRVRLGVTRTFNLRF